VGGGELTDAQGLAEAVGAADVGHQVARRAALDQLAELEARDSAPAAPKTRL
jgi:hypothetical protein